MHLRHWLGRIYLLTAAGAAAALLFFGHAEAQGPQCPPGFVFDRNSGVGCVQENCSQISGGHYSYTGSCICNEGLKGCFQQLDSHAFDQDLCGPFCPYSVLNACIAPDASCPEEQPAAQPQNDKSLDPQSDPNSQDEPVDSAGAPQQAGGDEELNIDALTRILEEALIPQPPRKSAEWREAAAAILAGLGVLVFLVSLLPPTSGSSVPSTPTNPSLSLSSATSRRPTPAPVHMPEVEHIYDHSPGRILSGDEARRFLEDTGALSRLSRLRHGADWEVVIEAMRGDPGKTAVSDFAINWKDDGTPNLDDLVMVIPETQPLSNKPPQNQEPKKPLAGKPADKPSDVKLPPDEKKPPEKKKPPPEIQKPPDLKQMLERARQERSEAMARNLLLWKEAIQLSQQLQQAKLEWDHTRVKAVSDGIIDMVDVVTDIKQVKFLATETFGGAYLKDLLKNTLKNLVAGGVTYVMDGDQPVRLTPEKLLEEFSKPSGFLSSADYEALNKDPNKAKEYILDVIMPGGGLKQVVQNALERSGHKRLSQVYGPGETVVKGVRDTVRAQERCAELRAQMVKLQERLGKVKSGMEDTQMDFEIANSAVRRNEANLAELKKEFPHRFANL